MGSRDQLRIAIRLGPGSCTVAKIDRWLLAAGGQQPGAIVFGYIRTDYVSDGINSSSIICNSFEMHSLFMLVRFS